MKFALDVPAARVINEVRGKTQLFELKSHGIKLRPRRGPSRLCAEALTGGGGRLWITSAGFRRIDYSLDMEDSEQAAAAAPEVPGYDVGRRLGQGGSASVWLVTAQSSGRDFALKCFDARHGRCAGGTENGRRGCGAKSGSCPPWTTTTWLGPTRWFACRRR